MSDAPALPFMLRWRRAVLAVEAPRGARVSTSVVRLVGLTLSTHMNADGGSCRPGGKLLADETALDRATVVRAVKVLVDAGVLASTRTGSSSRYQALLPVEKTGENPPIPVDDAGEYREEMWPETTSDVADDHNRCGLEPHKGDQEGETEGVEVQDHLLLDVDISNDPAQVAALVEASLGAIA